MSMSKKGLVIVLGSLGLGVALIIASAKKASASPRPKPAEEDEDVIIQPPSPDTGMPDGSVPPITVSTDENGKVTAVTTEDESGQAVDVTPSPVPTATDPVPVITQQPPTPLSAAEIQPQNDPYGTVLLARLLLAREVAPKWKEDMKPEVASWQSKVGLEADGLFGVKSVARMAREVGILPLVRYWSKSKHPNKNIGLKDYQASIQGAIATLESGRPETDNHIAALKMSVGREKGQGFSQNPAPNNTLEEVNRITVALGVTAEKDADRILQGA